MIHKQMTYQDIKNFSLKELETFFLKNNIPAFRARQIFKWIYLKQSDSFDEMTDLSRVFREKVKTLFTNKRLETAEIKKSVDGSEKFLFRLEDGNHIESVLIPEKGHFTLCISSQAGCAQNCRFCMTARKGLKRNLSTCEIISQIRDIQNYLNNKNLKEQKRLSNIVFMGMGEPLDNYDNVVRAIKIITDQDFGLKISRRRVTVSTSGLIPQIEKLGKDTNIALAVSLNAVTDELRSKLMPINKKFPIKDLINSCRQYPMSKREKITFEYILIKDVNDSLEDAKKLAKLLRKVKAKINLIPFNTHPGSNFKRPEREKIENFGKILLDNNYTVIIRWSKGRDINAACGQLSAAHDLQP
ncbi:MAG: 23S rRNA (adenine(2503)-C(2))-methyltransferase RlmN [Deltaproteobacteria bacterium]|nr:MAG: 23S rRNA (adenine(2503)-C(2))-methyltransferase RlmN [Deltaproteobacteria bacterium]